MIMASPNFSMDELTHSDTATRHNIDNTPNDNEKDNLYKLAMEMENVRKLLNNNPIFVSSGYRCLALNELLGSKKTSSHIKGLGCDFVCRKFGSPKEIVKKIIESDIEYDQVIEEHGSWVHIGFSKNNPRKQALIISRKGTIPFYSETQVINNIN
jgi:zinc D-Ala-D-Ala carboxypeptidase